MILEVQGLDPRFCGLGPVEVLVYGSGLRLPESDEVDYVGEDLDKPVVGGLGKVGEGEVGDTALSLLATDFPKKETKRKMNGIAHLNQ